MKRAFTLIELLVVIAIMAILGGVSISGYRQMKRGMAERGTMQNVNQFIHTAYERAQIDRRPVAICYWNETLQGKDSDTSEIVVGRAVAIRMAGRITTIFNGDELYDEFGDFNYNKKIINEDEDSEEDTDVGNSAGINFYQFVDGKVYKSVVYEYTMHRPIPERLLVEGSTKELKCYAYKIKEKGDATWSVGDAYGFEFADITLPHGYIFGESYSDNVNDPIKEYKYINFKVGENSSESITVYSLRPGKTGALSPEKVGTTKNPSIVSE